jgi:two-component system phosphate regulon response regulator OmpR
MAEAAHILVVDDDTRLRELLQRYLSEQGFRVTTAKDAAQARATLRALAFDLMILDVMMPGESGMTMLRDLRRDLAVPVLMLTALDETETRIEGFESGADDYLAKPFEPRELVLRVQAILRRANAEGQGAPAPRRVHFGAFSFDLDRVELRRGDGYVKLPGSELQLLRALAERAGTAVSREDLSEASDEIGNARTIDVQVTRLRRKIEADPKYPRYLQTVRGIGYALMPD